MGPSSLFGLPVYISPTPLVRQVPIRTHKKRRNQSVAYHKRVQKKWTKRWGTTPESYVLMMNPREVGLSGPSFMVLDPKQFAMLRNLGV